jgi:Zn-finger nucleic acid-binding protein
MKCPTDDIELVIAERQGIEIDYCPKCRGVWLDRGELDKLIDRSALPVPKTPSPGRERDSPHYGDQAHQEPHSYRKRKSLLGELFDF